MNAEAARIIARLGLVPLPVEGGYFRRTWTGAANPPGGRASGTAIHFLVTATDFSALHRLKADEVWCFHAGDPVEQVQLIAGEPAPRVTILGDAAVGLHAQVVVAAGMWQGARLATRRAGLRPAPPRGWALMTCFMAPGWDDREFQLGDRAALRREFPGATATIDALTR